jgi:gas vesicle protein
MSTPDEIRAQIAQTRMELSSDVDELGDKVSPGQIAKRQVGRVTGSAMKVRNHIMGAADSGSSSAGDALSSVQDAVAGAPGQVKQQTQGNPMAAGVIAFGASMLLSSLFPASKPEAQAAAAVKEQAQPLVDQVTDAAKDAASNLQEPAQQALESVKSTATDAVDTVKEEGTSAAEDVKDQAQDAKDTVQQHSSDNRAPSEPEDTHHEHPRRPC